MDVQQRLDEIQQLLSDFEAKLTNSENSYKASLDLITDASLRSSLMESHMLHIERQKVAIARLEDLYRQLQNQPSDIK